MQEIREADEWTRWANATQQEELCKRAEALLEEQDLEKASLALRKRHAVEQVAQAPRAQAETLWRRFKTARDQVQVRCREHFARLAQERGENLKKKQALCEKAEALADSSDWIRTAEAMNALQAEWKEGGPSRAARRRRCGSVSARPATTSSRAATKTAPAEAGVGEEPGDEGNAVRARRGARRVHRLGHGRREIKRLQAEWKTVGPARPSRSQPLWRRFHGAGDRFFERFKQRGSIEKAARSATLEALVAELESLSAEPAGAEVAARAPDLLARWRQAHGPAAEAPLVQRREAAMQRLLQSHPESFRGTSSIPPPTSAAWRSWWRGWRRS